MDLESAYDKIYRYVYFKVNDQTVAEDITQETFLRFISQKGSIHGYEIKYLYTIARNLCVDEYRRVKPDSLPEGYEETTPTRDVVILVIKGNYTEILVTLLVTTASRYNQKYM